MKRIVALLAALTLAPAIALASSVVTPSELSALGGLSVVASPLIVLSSPVLLISSVVESSSKTNTARVEVTTDKGAKETISLPKECVDKAKLKAGDKLTVKPTKAGALLSKNDVPLVYMVTPENAKLSRSHELAR